jgi:tetratricopeptide (TPR) repeat protein
MALDKESPGARGNQRNLGGCLYDMGNLLWAEGDHEKAAEHYRQALVVKEALAKREPDNAIDADDLAFFLAVCADPSFRDPARAIRLARGTVKQNRENASFWNTLGVAQYRHGQWQDALASLEKANRLYQERDESTWWFIAMAHWKLGENEAARSCYDRADKLSRSSRHPLDTPFADLVRFRAEAAQLLIKGDSR